MSRVYNFSAGLGRAAGGCSEGSSSRDAGLQRHWNVSDGDEPPLKVIR